MIRNNILAEYFCLRDRLERSGTWFKLCLAELDEIKIFLCFSAFRVHVLFGFFQLFYYLLLPPRGLQTFRGVRVSGLNEGNWWKFSTSNNRSSAGLHRTRYNLCARIESPSAQNSIAPLYEVSLPILFFPILIYRLERKRGKYSF